MVFACVAYKCRNRQNGDSKSRGISFFRFPKNIRKRRAWVTAINRLNWQPSEYSRLCSEHFIDGWHSDDHNDVNFAPTIFSYKSKKPTKEEEERIERKTKRSLQKEMDAAAQYEQERLEQHLRFSISSHAYHQKEAEGIPMDDNVSQKEDDDIDIISTKDEGTQCDEDPLLIENRELRKTVADLQSQLNRCKWGVNKIVDDDSKTKFYTGLPTFAVFLWLYNFLVGKAERMRYWVGANTDQTTDRQRASTTGSLDLIDQLLAVLMRIRVGLFTSDIADRFGISEGTFSKYFATWLSLLSHELKQLNPFPTRENIDRTMPLSFKTKYPSVRVILDCTEIFIQRSSSLVNQCLTYSSYKHHTTVKFLVGITRSGIISFVSEGWPGKTSDRELTNESGIIDLLDENDSVMADKGFAIRDLLEKRSCKLNIPPFRGVNPQFSTDEVFETQEIASLRIHVERSIGRVKNFHILDGVLPLTLQPHVTKIFQVACWLTNFDVPLVSS